MESRGKERGEEMAGSLCTVKTLSRHGGSIIHAGTIISRRRQARGTLLTRQHPGGNGVCCLGSDAGDGKRRLRVFYPPHAAVCSSLAPRKRRPAWACATLRVSRRAPNGFLEPCAKTDQWRRNQNGISASAHSESREELLRRASSWKTRSEVACRHCKQSWRSSFFCGAGGARCWEMDPVGCVFQQESAQTLWAVELI